MSLRKRKTVLIQKRRHLFKTCILWVIKALAVDLKFKESNYILFSYSNKLYNKFPYNFCEVLETDIIRCVKTLHLFNSVLKVFALLFRILQVVVIMTS